MSAPCPTPAQLRAFVRVALQRFPDEAHRIGLRAAGYAGPGTLEVGGRSVPVRHCASPLAVREALLDHADERDPLVLLVDLEPSALGQDVLARLLKERVLALNPWELALDLFRARELDRALRKERWLAEALIEEAPDEGYPPAPTGVLDADTAWQQVLDRRFGLASARPSLDEILAWLSQARAADAVRASPAEIQDALAARLEAAAGEPARAVLDAATAGRASVVALGLTLAVLAHDERERESALREGLVRLEPRLGRRIELGVARTWARAAEDLVRREVRARGRAHVQAWLDEAEALLGATGAGALAHLSDLLPAGLRQRCESLALQVERALAQPIFAVDAALDAAAAAVARHELTRSGPVGGGSGAGVAVEMGLRVARWLAAEEAQGAAGAEGAASFGEAARRYADGLGLLDLACRAAVDQADGPALRRAFGALAARADARRREQDRRFGVLLADWVRVAARPDGELLVEQVLARVVGPLAKHAPVLLLVLDGLSYAAWGSLEEDVVAAGWIPLRAQAPPLRGPVIAAFPTVTEVSRTSLLTGSIGVGHADDEKAGFAAHRALAEVSAPRMPPVLFHKGQLHEQAGALADRVYDALADGNQRVVGVVVNAIDDHLLKGDQLRVAWTVDLVRPLGALLAAAREGGRLLVVTGDHGHVLERGTRYVAAENASERYRPDDGPLQEDEVRLAGPRVVAAATGGALRAPWSDRLRYSQGKRHGYHGGASPAEVLVPLGVFGLGRGEPPPGWEEARFARPEWWRPPGEGGPPVGGSRRTGDRGAAEPAAPPVDGHAPLAAKPSGPALPLFDRVRPQEGTGVPVGTDAGARVPAAQARGGAERAQRPSGADSWLDALFASPVFRDQLARAARAAPTEERIRATLGALLRRGGRMTLAGLATEVDVPVLRMRGTVAALRRVLNVDGYLVLALDEASETVILDDALARVQFEIGS